VYLHRHQRLPHPETGGGKSFTLDDPTRRFIKKASWLGRDGKLAPLRDAQT
jgi:hypothetical protein